MGIAATTPPTTCACFTATATTSFTVRGVYDKGPYPEEPREGKALTRGSGTRVVNTPCNTYPATVQITHSAHPLCGQWVTVRSVLQEGQEYYLLVEWPDNGQVRRIPQAWTDQAVVEPATPGARFTPQQLRTLRQWLDARLPVALDKEAERVSPEKQCTISGGDPYASEARPDPAAGSLASSLPTPTATTPHPAEPMGAAGGTTHREIQPGSATRRAQ
jgi:hypothetical protein